MALLVILSGCIVAIGQNSFDRNKFEGKWILDRGKSSENISIIQGQEVLQISYTAPHFKIEKSQTRSNDSRSATLTLFTDKRGERNKPFPFDAQREISSTSAWEQEALVRSYLMENSVKGGRPQEIPAREVYRLSKDGMALTVVDEMLLPPEANIASARRQVISKRVYRRGN